MTRIAIFGAGGLGSIVRDILLQSRAGEPVAFLDSDAAKHGRRIDGLTVLGGIGALDRARYDAVVVAIGDNQARVSLAEEIRGRGFRLASAIHPLSSVSPSARLGEHLIIGPRVTVCVHAAIADHCVLSAGAIVEHDNQIGRGVFLHPAVRLAGSVCVDDFASVGIGACVIPGRRIGRAAQVEPGAIVIADVLAGAMCGGVPAEVWPRSRFVVTGDK